MKKYIKIVTNIVITSIGLSVAFGSLLRVIGPINQKNQTIKNFYLVKKARKNVYNQLGSKGSAFLNLLKNNREENSDFKNLKELTLKWENIINKNPDLEVSALFISSDNNTYADINSNFSLPAASSIKIPILIALLIEIDQGNISWNEEITLTKDSFAGGSGWMAYQEPGRKFPIYEIATEMIRVSDNTATNLLIKRLGGIDQLNKIFNDIGLKNTKIKNYLPDLKGTNLTTTKDLILAIALVDEGYFLNIRSRDTFREIMSKSKTNTLIPSGILRGLGKNALDIDYYLSIKGYSVYNKTGDIGIAYSDTALIQTPYYSRAFASFIVKGPFNDPRSTELIRDLSAEMVPFLGKSKTSQNTNKKF